MPKRRSLWPFTWLPSPNTNRPFEFACRSQAWLAITVGLRGNATAIDGVSSIRSVASAAKASGVNTSWPSSTVVTASNPADSAAAPNEPASRQCLIGSIVKTRIRSTPYCYAREHACGIPDRTSEMITSAPYSGTSRRFGWMPRDALRMFARLLFRLCYRVEVRGLENFAAAGDRVIIVPNHVSFLDPPLVAAFLPGRPVFAIDPAQMRRWWVKPFLAFVNVFPMEPTRPMAAKSLIKSLKEDGGHCVIFPEGRLNVTGGALMKVYDGPAMIADKAEATVLPVRLDGVEFTPFSRLADRLRRRWFPKVTITILEPRRLAVPAELRGRVRRHRAGVALYDMMSEMMARRPDPSSLFAAMLEACVTHGGGHRIIEDPGTPAVTYNRVVAASFVLGRKLARGTRPGERVGLMVPNSVGAAIAFFALQATGRVPAMLNHTAGIDGVLAACKISELRRVVTSRRFVEAAKLVTLAERLADAVEMIWLEDVRAQLGLFDKLYGAFALRFAGRLHARRGVSAGDPAAVLFTSGSEGEPKGVALSHANLLTNRRQIAARVDFSPADLALNALPMFHSFGLTGGFLLPLLSGVRVFLYPSPLHYRIVPEIAYMTGATILFGTDTVLTGYARRANPYDFHALRYVFAGAEPVRKETG